jgi:hypothetical protein
MRVSVFFFFLALAISLNAQPGQGYMIFQTEGKVSLIRDGMAHERPDGKSFVEGDAVRISAGWATFLDEGMKRVTVKEEGTISYEEVKALFKKATASLENKYLVYMWEKMNEKEEHTSKKGGVVRGEEFLFFPFDSAILLNPEWCFTYYNPEKIRAILLVKDAGHTLKYPVQSADSLVCFSLAKSPLEPGVYFWNVSIPGAPTVQDRMMIIPTEAEKTAIMQEIENLGTQLKDIPEPERTSLVNDIVRMNHWLL